MKVWAATATAVALLLPLAEAAASAADLARGSQVQGLFRIRRSASGLSPAQTVWYVPKQTPHFVKVGLADVQPPGRARGGVSAWFARWRGHNGPRAAAADLPSAVIAAGSPLPLPSVVTVTDIETGAVVAAKVEEEAPLGAGFISLSPQAAAALGKPSSSSLFVRVRYIAPLIPYEARPRLEYAFRARRRDEPSLAAADLSRAAAPAILQPLPARAPAPSEAPTRPSAQPADPPGEAPAPSPPHRVYRIQAGAFAVEANARRAAATLAPLGPTLIERAAQRDRVLHRVLVLAEGEPAHATALRARMAALGFPDAAIVRP